MTIQSDKALEECVASGQLSAKQIESHLRAGDIAEPQQIKQASKQEHANAIRISDNVVAVDHSYEWQPMMTCPRNVKVQLLNAGGVATYGHYEGNGSFWQGWAPLPCKPRKEIA